MVQSYKSYVNWSGGKDSALALYFAMQQQQYAVEHLLTNVNEVTNRVTMHGVTQSLIIQQSCSLNIPISTVSLPLQPSMEVYEQRQLQATTQLLNKGFTHSIFGDIFLEDLKAYRVAQMAQSGMQPVFPLWKMDSLQLLKVFFELGFKAIVVCVNATVLDRSFAGRLLNQQFINDLPPNVDPCGENGEYHTFVFDGPGFNKAVEFKKGEIVLQNYKTPSNKNDECFNTNTCNAPETGFWFCDLVA